VNQFYIGLMSGTSLDGVDVAIVDFNGETPSLISSHFETYPSALYLALKEACQQTTIAFNELGTVDSQLGSFYAQCIQHALLEANISTKAINAIGSHGHTVHHSPNSKPPFTLQIGDANCIAEKTGVTVVSDFRRRDIAAGGQGAPLVPAFHYAVFQSEKNNLAIINIGGISNITYLDQAPREPTIGFDCGPGNTLMDQWCQRHFDMPFDKSGALSETGSIYTPLLDSMMADPYFSLAHPKSTGPEYFNLAWLTQHLARHPCNINDTLSTLCELTARCIVLSLEKFSSVNKALICGGGVHNAFLMQRLRSLLDIAVATTASHGVDPDWVEAMAFAWLAKQTMEGKTGNTPSVTGAKKAVILGAIYSA